MGRYSELFQLTADPLNTKEDGKTPFRICLFTDVKNIDDLIEAVKDERLRGAFVKAELIYSIFHLLAAANKALYGRVKNEMRTKNVHTELLFALSPSMNISQSLQEFAVDSRTKHVLVAIFDDQSGAELNKVLKVIEANAVPLSELKKVANLELIRKVYSLRRPELNYDNYDDAIVSKIISKELVNH